MSFRDWSSVVGTWVSITAALAGGAFALRQYERDVEAREDEIAKQVDARVVQTFDLFKVWQGADMLHIRTKFFTAAEMGQVQSLALAGDQELFAYIDFFDAVQVCLEHELCEPALTDQLFGVYAKVSYGAARDTIMSIRTAECAPELALTRPAGYGLEALATGAVPAVDCP